jgi:hypothetical protein
MRRICGFSLALPHSQGKNATLVWQTEYTVIFLNCKQKDNFLNGHSMVFFSFTFLQTRENSATFHRQQGKYALSLLQPFPCNVLNYQDLIVPVI